MGWQEEKDIYDMSSFLLKSSDVSKITIKTNPACLFLVFSLAEELGMKELMTDGWFKIQNFLPVHGAIIMKCPPKPHAKG